jgi:Lhr-like helicase
MREYMAVGTMQDDSAKWAWLTSRLSNFVQEGKLLVFVSSKTGAEELADNLAKQCKPILF